MEKSNFDESVFFFFFVLMRETCTGPDVKKKKGKITNKTNWSAEERNGKKRKHKLFSSSSLPIQKGCRGDIVGHIIVVVFSRCIVRRYSREDTSASAFKHE